MNTTEPTGGDRSVGSRLLSGALLPVFCLFLAACGGGDGDRVLLYPVEGRVEVDGEAAEGIKVTLHPADRVGDIDALRPRGTTGPDGSFTLGTYEAGDGAPAGHYLVTLFWPDAPPGPSPPDDRLGGAYANPETSDLRVTIRDEPTRLEPFRVAERPALRRSRRPAMPDVDGMMGPGG